MLLLRILRQKYYFLSIIHGNIKSLSDYILQYVGCKRIYCTKNLHHRTPLHFGIVKFNDRRATHYICIIQYNILESSTLMLVNKPQLKIATLRLFSIQFYYSRVNVRMFVRFILEKHLEVMFHIHNTVLFIRKKKKKKKKTSRRIANWQEIGDPIHHATRTRA